MRYNVWYEVNFKSIPMKRLNLILFVVTSMAFNAGAFAQSYGDDPEFVGPPTLQELEKYQKAHPDPQRKTHFGMGYEARNTRNSERNSASGRRNQSSSSGYQSRSQSRGSSRGSRGRKN